MRHIEFARRRKHWSQQQLAALVRLTQSNISAIERGVLLPTPEERERLARALDVDPASLLAPVAAVPEKV